MLEQNGRERLWRGMLPPALPQAADIDFAFLARQFALAGGDIRNVVLDAAYAAAGDAAPLSMRHLLQAVAKAANEKKQTVRLAHKNDEGEGDPPPPIVGLAGIRCLRSAS